MNIREELIMIGCRKMCEMNNEDPDYIATSHHVTLGRVARPNWEYRRITIEPVVDAIIERLRSRRQDAPNIRQREDGA